MRWVSRSHNGASQLRPSRHCIPHDRAPSRCSAASPAESSARKCAPVTAIPRGPAPAQPTRTSFRLSSIMWTFSRQAKHTHLQSVAATAAATTTTSTTNPNRNPNPNPNPIPNPNPNPNPTCAAVIRCYRRFLHNSIVNMCQSGSV